MKNIACALVISCLAGLNISVAQAEALHWDIWATFRDGGGLSGGFNFDPSASQPFSNITLVTTLGDLTDCGGFCGRDFSHATASVAGDHASFFLHNIFEIEHETYLDMHYLVLSGLNLAQQPSTLLPIRVEEGGSVSWSTEGHSGSRQTDWAFAYAQPVPEPAAYGMLCAGMVLLWLGVNGRYRKPGYLALPA